MKRLLLCVAGLVLFLGVTGQAKAQYSFTTFDPPGSTSTNPLGGGINDAGWIVGSYDDVNGTHGYLLRDGKYTPLDFREAILTRANAINDLGQIVGMYRDAGDILHGFLSDGSTIDFPDAENGTTARGINAPGLIVGGYDNAPGMIFLHGFLLRDGKYTTIDFPGAVGLNEAQDINDPGQIVGRYDDAGGIRHGYVRSEDGFFTTLDVPGFTFTVAFGINDSGQIVGAYRDADGIRHGFLRMVDGSYITLDPLGSTDTIAWKINDCGLIVGTYVDAGGSNHGFLATPNDNNGGSNRCNEK